MKRSCPHANILDCPLYYAAHNPALMGFACDDGHLDEGGCAVTRAMDYDRTVDAMKAVRPLLVATLRRQEAARESGEQIARNRRFAR